MSLQVKSSAVVKVTCEFAANVKKSAAINERKVFLINNVVSNKTNIIFFLTKKLKM